MQEGGTLDSQRGGGDRGESPCALRSGLRGPGGCSRKPGPGAATLVTPSTGRDAVSVDAVPPTLWSPGPGSSPVPQGPGPGLRGEAPLPPGPAAATSSQVLTFTLYHEATTGPQQWLPVVKVEVAADQQSRPCWMETGFGQFQDGAPDGGSAQPGGKAQMERPRGSREPGRWGVPAASPWRRQRGQQRAFSPFVWGVNAVTWGSFKAPFG